VVGLEYLKLAMVGQMKRCTTNYCYDMQLRYALGLRKLGEGDFDLRTLYYFRERLSRYMQEKGVNLFGSSLRAGDGPTDCAFRLKTGKQRDG